MRFLPLMFLLVVLPLLGEEVKGPVEIFGTVYEKVDPGPPFKEAPRQIEDWQAPPPTSQERKAGFIPYTRPEPFDIKPWSKPKKEERIGKLQCSLAQGEMTSLWFAVYALEPLSSLSIKVQPLKKGSNPSIEIRYAHFWAQRTDWRGRTYYITPELLLPASNGYVLLPAKGGTLERRSLDIPQGESRLFWLTIKASENLPSGDYQFTLKIQAKGKSSLNLPVSLHIYPFRLLKPENRRWLLYSDTWLWGNLPDEKVLRILRGIKEHGIDGFTELPFGKLDLSGLKEGVVKYDASPLIRFANLMKQVGFKGPHTIGAWVEGECAQALGLQVDLNKEWPEELKQAVIKVAKRVVDTLKPTELDWLFYGWDEPGPENLAALQQYRCWYEGGAKTYVTFYDRGTYEVAGQWMTAPCFSVGLIYSEEMAKWVRHQCDVRRQKFFWYGSGCYLGQEGRIFPNRYLTGWLFYKTKADAEVSWTFVRPHEDPFNDFDGINANKVEPKDQCTTYPWFSRPNDYSSLIDIIPTIQWEAIREGINDYCYAYTLSKMIEEVKKRKGKDWEKLAREAEETLRAVEESVPWGNEVGKRGYSNKELMEARSLLGKELERVSLALKGKKISEKSIKKEIKLSVLLLPPEMAEISREVPLPILSIPQLSTAPKVDGEVREEEWIGSSSVNMFFDSETGKPMRKEIETRAYIGYDDGALYIGFICGGDTKKMKMAKWARDGDGIWQDEGVEIFLASADEPHRYAHIIVNASGSVYDEIVFDTSWNPEIEVGTKIEEERWECELKIPWGVLPKGKTPQIRLNLCRNHSVVDGETSHWAWSPTFGWFHNPSRFGIAKLTASSIILSEVVPPTLFGDEFLNLKVFNRGNEEKEILIDGKALRVPPRGEVKVSLKVPSSIGEHKYNLRLKYDNQVEEWQIPYAIPEPLKAFSRVILPNERGEATLSVALSVSEELKEKKKLVLEVDGKRYWLSMDKREQTINLSISSFPAEISLYISDFPEKYIKARLMQV